MLPAITARDMLGLEISEELASMGEEFLSDEARSEFRARGYDSRLVEILCRAGISPQVLDNMTDAMILQIPQIGSERLSIILAERLREEKCEVTLLISGFIRVRFEEIVDSEGIPPGMVFAKMVNLYFAIRDF